MKNNYSSAITNTDGVATLNHIFNSVGSYDINSNFQGNADYYN
ncbi:hypothetical protein ALNOE001_11840 [Candidatus Methanobinarius endosymbioticus]|uniref:Uncharacterized protein n=1 Tax=Candidatus Methanobinarius endosymbioticus TaxID=2006182 RepID=A0A366MA13_9EURY|nr:hypothetical protein ALNOE001_11840 [Candidatus Methanobinarius endosymbioticus]